MGTKLIDSVRIHEVDVSSQISIVVLVLYLTYLNFMLL